jgi:hypothetical protein
MWEQSPGYPHHRHTCYQLSYNSELKEVFFYWTYKVTVKKVGNTVVYYNKTVECLHLIFWPRSQRRVHCHTAKLEPNRWVTIDWVPLLAFWLVGWLVGWYTPHSALKIKIVCSTETLVPTYKSTWHLNPDDHQVIPCQSNTAFVMTTLDFNGNL